MTTIRSLPPEILLQIFELATDDPGLLIHTPSWRHYDLPLATTEPDTPWPAPSQEAEETAMRLVRVCRRWRSLAVRFELRHVRIRRAEQVQAMMGRLSENSDAGNTTKRITISLCPSNYEAGLWDSEDTTLLVELLKSCPNLEVFSLQGAVDSPLENWSACEIILRTFTSSCRKLKRLHLLGGSPFDLPVTDLGLALAPVSSLEALEISPRAGPLPQPQLASLKRLRVYPQSLAPKNAAHELGMLFPASRSLLQIARRCMGELRHSRGHDRIGRARPIFCLHKQLTDCDRFRPIRTFHFRHPSTGFPSSSTRVQDYQDDFYVAGHLASSIKSIALKGICDQHILKRAVARRRPRDVSTPGDQPDGERCSFSGSDLKSKPGELAGFKTDEKRDYGVGRVEVGAVPSQTTLTTTTTTTSPAQVHSTSVPPVSIRSTASSVPSTSPNMFSNSTGTPESTPPPPFDSGSSSPASSEPCTPSTSDVPALAEFL